MQIMLEKFQLHFGYVFASSMTVQSFSTIRWQEKNLSMIKIYKFFVSDHLNRSAETLFLGIISYAEYYV